jgi:hypothetical protein
VESPLGFIFTTKCHPSLIIGPIPADLTYFDYALALTFLIPTLLFAYDGITQLLNGFAEYTKYRACKHAVDRLAGSYGGAEWTIVRHGLVKEVTASKEKIMGSIGNLIFAGCFVYFTVDAFHIVMEDHKRTIVNVIMVSEIVLSYFIYGMWARFRGRMVTRSRLKRLSAVLRRDDCCDSLENFLTTVGGIGYLLGDMYDAFLAVNPVHVPAWKQVTNADLAVATELDTVKIFLTYLTDGKSDECKRTRLAVADCLDYNATIHAKRIPLDLLYFLLNCISWCGYAVGVTVYYVPASSLEALIAYVPYIRNVLAVPVASLPFYGDLVGNASWTLEPMVIAWDGTYMPADFKTVPYLKSRPELSASAKEIKINSKASADTTVRKRTSRASRGG